MTNCTEYIIKYNHRHSKIERGTLIMRVDDYVCVYRICRKINKPLL